VPGRMAAASWAASLLSKTAVGASPSSGSRPGAVRPSRRAGHAPPARDRRRWPMRKLGVKASRWERGTTHVFRGTSHANRGMGHAFRGKSYLFHGSGHPFRGSGHAFRGSSHPFRGSSHPFRGSSHAFRGSSHVFRGLDNPKLGKGHAFRGKDDAKLGEGNLYEPAWPRIFAFRADESLPMATRPP